MNDEMILKVLSEKTNKNKKDCLTIYSIFEKYPIIGKKNKEKIKKELIEKLSIKKEEAEEIYTIFSEILIEGIKESIKHPFKSK